MAKLSYEPNRVAGGIGAVLVTAGLGLLVYYKVLDLEASGAWAAFLLPVVAFVQGEIARRNTYPVAKIEDAARVDESFDPETINQKARAGRRRKEAAKEGPSV